LVENTDISDKKIHSIRSYLDPVSAGSRLLGAKQLGEIINVPDVNVGDIHGNLSLQKAIRAVATQNIE